jgi:hypothetical protein
MSRSNRAGMTKPDKSHSGLNSYSGEWWAYQESPVAKSQCLISQVRSDLSPPAAVMYRPSLDTERLRTSLVCCGESIGWPVFTFLILMWPGDSNPRGRTRSVVAREKLVLRMPSS